MKIKFIIFTLFCTFWLNNKANAQICNYCSIEELQSTLKENDIDYSINYNVKSKTVFTHKEEYFIKEWHVEYNMCYLYRIIVLDQSKVKSLKSLINKHFNPISENNWESLDNIVNLELKEGYYNFSFYPKANYHNLNLNNNY